MFRRIQSRRSREGFTLIELLIVVAIIGIIAVILIPNLLDALQKAKQKATVADIRELMQAVFSWTTDQVGAASAGSARTFDLAALSSATATEVRNLLVPTDTSKGQIRYIQEIPDNDGWGTAMEYYMAGGAGAPQPLTSPFFAIRSLGQGGEEGCDECETDAPGPSYTIGAFPTNEYQQDIVGADGYFVRWPSGTQTGTATP